MTYIGKDTIALLANTTLETEGQVVAADHDTTAKTLLKWLHVWFDAWEVQPLDVRQEEGQQEARRQEIKTTRRERFIQWRGETMGEEMRTEEERKRTKTKEIVQMVEIK